MKKAFSLLEILIVTVIVGIIAVTMITTVRPRDLEVGHLYISAYTFLKDASDNIFLDAQSITHDHKTEVDLNSQTFCNSLTDYINTTVAPTCGNAGTIGFAAGTFSPDWKPSLIASNTMKIYVTSPGTINGEKYLKIWVDLNGDRKPNTSTWTEGSPADVVAFAVDSQANLIILGAPLFDTRYVWGRIHYTTNENGKGVYSKKLPFYQAQYRAFLGQQTDDYLSKNLNDYMSGDLKAPANKMPAPTITSYDSEMCQNVVGGVSNSTYSSCTVQVLN